MAKFIPIDKIKTLREANINGDERAKHILEMQLNGEDFSKEYDDYFSNKKTEGVSDKPIIEKNNENNFIKKNVAHTIRYLKNEEEDENQIKELLKSMMCLIQKCDGVILELMNKDMTESSKKGALSTVQEIKDNNIKNVDTIRKLIVELNK